MKKIKLSKILKQITCLVFVIFSGSAFATTVSVLNNGRCYTNKSSTVSGGNRFSDGILIVDAPILYSCESTYGVQSTTGTISNLTNSSTINPKAYSTSGDANRGIYITSSGGITSLVNTGTGTITSTLRGIDNNGRIGLIDNSGIISGSGVAINNEVSGIITTIINRSGATISSSGGDGIYIGSGSIESITNIGIISGGVFGISNSGGIGTLNNSQGALSSALTYKSNLPTNYNIIINSTSNYGQLAVNSVTGTMAFNIYGYTGQTLTSGVSGSSVRDNYLYQNVLTGLIGSLSGSTITGTGFSITGAKGSYGGYSYTLVADDSNVSGVWDLLFGSLGPSALDTQSSLTRLASRLRGVYNGASLISNFPNSNTYDCNLFDVKGMCISAGGRYSTVDNPNSNSTAAVVTLGYKVNPNIRIGGFLDQSINNNNPTGVHLSNSNPMMGVFAYWNQNPDGLGYQVKLANAYQDKDLSTTRDVIGTSEAGRGTTSLTTQSYVGELSYAFMFEENTLVRPYFALRYTTTEQDAYTETGVTTPLTYSALNDRTTSALMGVKFKHALTPKANLIGSLGVEQDLHHKTGQLTASGVSGLTSENFSGDLHRTRPVASIGATYDIAKTQRLTGEVLVQQLPFQSTAGATAYFNYMIGF